ncbi:VanZ family protein [Microbacterium sp. MAHUQ-60]|uniref:VanZ family protein n=1 Tax=unclassified Microbacterium TaxID=2609290 RepID=UPI00360B5595
MSTLNRRRWIVAALAVYALAAAVILVSPVRYSGIVRAIGEWLRGDLALTGFGTGWIEFFANAVMFAPLGFLLTAWFRHPWRGVVLAVVLSVGAELAQVVIPQREPSLRDVFANALGAAVGALLAWLLVMGRSRRARAGVAAPSPVRIPSRAEPGDERDRDIGDR